MKRWIVIFLWFSLACDAASGDGNSGPGPGDEVTPEAEILGEGDAFPDVSLLNCDGEAVSMGDFLAEHEVSFVTFGAQWCKPCQEEAPIINQVLIDGVQTTHPEVGVVQILIEARPNEAPSPSLCGTWRDALDARFLIYADTERDLMPPFFGEAITHLPLHLIVGADGTIHYRKLGALPEDLGELVLGWLP